MPPPRTGGGCSLPRQQIAGGRLQDVLRHAWLAAVDSARPRLADILFEPCPPLVRNRTQDNDGAVIGDLDMLPAFGHGSTLPAAAWTRQRSAQATRQRSNSLRKA